MQYQTTVHGLNTILQWTNKNKKLPQTLTLNIAKTNAINKNIPQYTRPQNLPQNSTSLGESKENKSNNFTVVQSKSKYGPTEVKYNNESLISTGRCSCGNAGDYSYHNSSFINYCPYCKVYGTMVYEENESCPEGMWVCTKCDADFCLVTGKEHIVNNPKYLTPSS